MVTEIAMSHYRVAGLSRFLRLGECVSVDAGDRFQLGEVVQNRRRHRDPEAIRLALRRGDRRARLSRGSPLARAAPGWKGRAIDALGRPIDGGEPLPPGDRVMPLDSEPPPALQRSRLASRSSRESAHRLFHPAMRRQRIGVFSGSGVGKSTLLSMLARAPDFDTVVIALVGERGREVREFLDDALADNRHSAIAVSPPATRAR